MLKLGHKCNAIFIINDFNRLQHLQSFTSSSSSSSSSLSKVSSENQSHLLHYLVNSLGFSKQQSLSNLGKISRTVASKNLTNSCAPFIGKSDTVIEYLKQHGFEISDIRKIVRQHPKLLSTNIDLTLKPKLRVLEELGVIGKDLVDLLVRNPYLLRFQLRPPIEVMRSVLGKDENVVRMLRQRFDLTLATRYLEQNVSLLKESGVSIDRIYKNLYWHAKVFVKKTELVQEAVVRVEKELGIPRECKMFVIGVCMMLTFSVKDIEDKIELFKGFGWTKSDVLELVKRNPYLLGFTEETLKKKLGFFVNELGYEPAYVISNAFMLSCSLERRVLPRHKLLTVLKEKGLKRMDSPLYYVLCLAEPKFVKRMVLPYKEVHNLYTKLTGHSLEKKPKSKAAA